MATDGLMTVWVLLSELRPGPRPGPGRRPSKGKERAQTSSRLLVRDECMRIGNNIWTWRANRCRTGLCVNGSITLITSWPGYYLPRSKHHGKRLVGFDPSI